MVKKKAKIFGEKNVIATVVLGVGVYSEVYYKSLPIITYVQDSKARTIDGFDYNGTFSAVQCSSIDMCEADNKKPHT